MSKSSMQRRVATYLKEPELIEKFKEFAKDFNSESEAAQQLFRLYYDNLTKEELERISQRNE